LRSWLMVVTIVLCGLLVTFFSAAIVDRLLPQSMWSVVAITAAVAVVFSRMLVLRLIARHRSSSERGPAGSPS
ncbi:MAG: hypothetical protein ACRDKS_16210, partial [Actinomycetota bacterium]